MKKFIAFLLSVTIMAALLVSCSTKKDSDTLYVGVDDSYPPMEYKDDTNTRIGFDIDLANKIGEKMDMKVEFISTAWDGIFQALKTDKFDCIISSVSIDPDRLKEFEFTKPYIANAQMIVVKPDNNSILKPEDLAGKNVGYQVATTANNSADTLQAKGIKFGNNGKEYDQIIQPFADMKAGRLDAIIVDEVVGQYYIGQDKANFKAASVKLTNEPIGVCIKKGNTDLRDKIQVALDEMVADGTMKQISMKWFNADMTSNIDTVLKSLE
ncbi:MAG: ABC transporter substrate-binding protein [Saccharofermentanales bacterium]